MVWWMSYSPCNQGARPQRASLCSWTSNLQIWPQGNQKTNDHLDLGLPFAWMVRCFVKQAAEVMVAAQ